jgi:hypothetical protein
MKKEIIKFVSKCDTKKVRNQENRKWDTGGERGETSLKISK